MVTAKQRLNKVFRNTASTNNFANAKTGLNTLFCKKKETQSLSKATPEMQRHSKIRKHTNKLAANNLAQRHG
jgi:hypothetical protein